MSPLFSFRACICCCYCHSLPRPNPSTSSLHQLQRTMASWLVQNSQGPARSAQSLTVCGIGPENSPKGVALIRYLFSETLSRPWPREPERL